MICHLLALAKIGAGRAFLVELDHNTYPQIVEQRLGSVRLGQSNHPNQKEMDLGGRFHRGSISFPLWDCCTCLFMQRARVVKG